MIYGIAAAVFYAIFWQITRFPKLVGVSYCLRAVVLALIITPWYVSDQGNLLAPAVIIVVMDAITIGGDAAVRAFVPLFLSMIIALVGVVIMLLVRRGGSR